MRLANGLQVWPTIKIRQEVQDLLHLKDRQDGLTLIELMLTIGVVGVLLTIGLPSFSDMIDRNRLKGAAESLYANVQRARSESIKRNDDIYVNFSANGSSTWVYGVSDLTSCTLTQTDPANAAACTIVVDDGDGTVHGLNSAVDTGDKLLMRFVDDQHVDVTMTLNSFTSGTQLVFNGRQGTTRDSATGLFSTGIVQLASGDGKRLDVRLSALGQVRICSPDSSVPGYQAC